MKFGMIDQENAASLRTLEKGKNELMRLDKFLTEMGLGTRSEVKKLLKTKQITVNGEVVTKPETKVEPETDKISYKGEMVNYCEYEYYLFYKPAGCVTATEDHMHKTVMDYLTDTVRSDLFPVGRLDIDTEGLLLITNDGALAHELLSPAKHVEKTYYAIIDGVVTEEDVNHFKNGVDIGEEKPTKPGKLRILNSEPESEIELTITEGRFHQVKRMFAALGNKVVALHRWRIGNVELDESLEEGEFRPLTQEEIDNLVK